MGGPTTRHRAAHARRQRPSVWRVLRLSMLGVLSVCVVGGIALIFAWHLRAQPILTGSMVPTYGPGWAVITRPVPVSQVRPGDIVVFVPPGKTAAFAHRVVTVKGTSAHPVVTTKGDANPAPDPWHARLQGATVPEVVAAVPFVGTVLLWVHGKVVAAVLVGLGGLAIGVAGVRSILEDASDSPPGIPSAATA
jgi:signal peptidase I